MSDFSSALYLGMRHPSSSLPPWRRLTSGRPAALEPPDGEEGLAGRLAGMLGHESAALGASTFHIFWDLFDLMANERIAIYMDAGVYPVVRWGVERARAKGVPARRFPHRDPEALRVMLERDRASGSRPLIVTDGLYPAAGRTAPLADYLALARMWGGHVVVDDTQALGILGRKPGVGAPYGRGGAGTPAWQDVQGPELIVGSSLAKGFGVPLAVLAGSGRAIAGFKERSSTRVHCSPPAVALINAAESALAVNAGEGDRLRGRLLDLIKRFRRGLRQAGLSADGGLFPVQTLKPVPGVDAIRVHERLSNLGVKAVLHRSGEARPSRLSFLITASHSPSEIDNCVNALEQSCLPAHARIGG